MVEIFKTTVERSEEAEQIILSLLEQFPDYKINFDLEDCDKILRVESRVIDLPQLEILLRELNCSFELVS